VATALAAGVVTANWIEGLRQRAGVARSVWRRHELVRDCMQGCNTLGVTIESTVSLQCFYSRNLVQMGFKFEFELFLNISF
jgi:hypothetical protein